MKLESAKLDTFLQTKVSPALNRDPLTAFKISFHESESRSNELTYTSITVIGPYGVTDSNLAVLLQINMTPL